jgi:hypothetical protein
MARRDFIPPEPLNDGARRQLLALAAAGANDVRQAVDYLALRGEYFNGRCIERLRDLRLCRSVAPYASQGNYNLVYWLTPAGCAEVRRLAGDQPYRSAAVRMDEA